MPGRRRSVLSRLLADQRTDLVQNAPGFRDGAFGFVFGVGVRRQTTREPVGIPGRDVELVQCSPGPQQRRHIRLERHRILDQPGDRVPADVLSTASVEQRLSPLLGRLLRVEASEIAVPAPAQKLRGIEVAYRLAKSTLPLFNARSSHTALSPRSGRV